jgi:hypothetical protein
LSVLGLGTKVDDPDFEVHHQSTSWLEGDVPSDSHLIHQSPRKSDTPTREKTGGDHCGECRWWIYVTMVRQQLAPSGPAAFLAHKVKWAKMQQSCRPQHTHTPLVEISTICTLPGRAHAQRIQALGIFDCSHWICRCGMPCSVTRCITYRYCFVEYVQYIYGSMLSLSLSLSTGT